MLGTDDSRQPYPGLRPFEADEADLFFGREQHIDALLRRLSGSHFVAVVGESGAGKSSLVRAGLLPALEAGFVVEAGSDWRVALMRPGGAPLAALTEALLSPGVLSKEGGAAHPEFALAEVRRGPLGIVQLVRDAHLDRHCNTLIVVDQFEELFRYCREPAQKDQANVFVELLLQASQQREVPIFVVLTMRSDFVGDCARFRGLPELLNDTQYLTPRLTRDEIAAAIRGPARVCGGIVDQALTDELCNAVGDDQDQLPLLQHLLMRLWDRATELSSPPRLTPELSGEMGGLHSALNKHAEQIYASLLTKERQAIACAMFKSLTDPRSQRRDLRRDALVSDVAAVAAVPADAVIFVADEFRAQGRHMLMPPPTVPLDASSRLDISHESLLRQWSTLAEWGREEGANAGEFDRLREEAKRERDQQGELLSGRALARALDWIKQAAPTQAWAERYAPPGDLDVTLTFIRSSDAEAKRRREEEQAAAKREAAARRATYYSWMYGGALVLAIVITIAIFTLYQRAEEQRGIAEMQRKEAEKQTELAKSNEARATQFSQNTQKQNQLVERQNKELAIQRADAHTSQLTANALVALLVTRDAPLAVLLAREAVLESGSDAAALAVLRDAIAAHVPSVQGRFSAPKSRNYLPGREKMAWLDFSLSAASVSPIGDLVITPSGNDAVIWSATSGESIRTLRGHKGIVASARFSPNGRLAVTTSADNTARVWNTLTGDPQRTLSHTRMVNGAVFNRNGTLLVTLGDDGIAYVWTVGDLAKPRCALSQQGNFILASFSDDQNLVATLIHNGPVWEAQVWDLARGGCPEVRVPLLEKPDNTEKLVWANFSDNGAWLGVMNAQGETVVLSVLDWKEQRRLVPKVRYVPSEEVFATPAAENLPPRMAWSHDGRFIAIANGDNTVELHEIAGSNRPPIELGGHTGRVTGIAFSPADDVLLTTSSDSTARAWTLSADKRVLERVVLSGHQDVVGSGVFNQKGDRIVTASDDGTVRSWRPLFALQERLFSGLRTASYSEDGKQILISGVSITPAPPRTVGFWVSELTAATLNEPGSARVLAESDRLKELDGTSPGGSIVFARAKSGITVWDLKTKAKPEQVASPSPTNGRSCVPRGISDDKIVAWYCADQDLVLVARPGQRQPVSIPIADEVRVESARFSTSGHLLALTLEDYSVRVFDSSTGKGRPIMKGHDGRIRSIDFNEDDHFLVSASEDSTARMWDVATGARIAVVATNATQLTNVTFSPDGLSVLLLSAGRLLVWRCHACVDAPKLLEEVRQRRIDRRLTQAEEINYRIKSRELNGARPEQQHSHFLQED